jgi:hypothetical protein
MRGHMSYVDSVAPMPNERIFMSVSKDCTARMYSINVQTMVDSVFVHKPARWVPIFYSFSVCILR